VKVKPGVAENWSWAQCG